MLIHVTNPHNASAVQSARPYLDALRDRVLSFYQARKTRRTGSEALKRRAEVDETYEARRPEPLRSKIERETRPATAMRRWGTFGAEGWVLQWVRWSFFFLSTILGLAMGERGWGVY